MSSIKNIFLLSISFIFISATQCIAQEQVLFQIKFKPNKTYVTEMLNDMQMDMDLDVDSAKRKAMSETGAAFPMHINMRQDMSVSTKTGDVAADKRIPMTLKYDKVDMTLTMNGKETKQPVKIANLQINAYATTDDKVRIDNIEGEDAKLKEDIQKMLDQMFQNIQFPDKAMKIGDTFTQEIPMDLPINGNSIKMLVNTSYTLKSVRGTQAFFDYTQMLNMSFKLPQGDMTATGSGTGRAVYDMPINYMTDTTGDLVMNMSMKMGEMMMKMNIKAKTAMKTKVL